MDWTTRLLDHWTIFWTMFWTIFSNHFLDHFIGEGRPLVLREGWDAVYQYKGSGVRQTVVTEGEVEDKLSVCREGKEVKVVVLVNAND